MSEIKAETTFPSGQRLEIVHGDITNEKVDAIVNAANAQLVHGGGVAGTIVRKGGQVIQAESDRWVKKYGPVDHAFPAYTSAGRLPCKYVIHAVGPYWGQGDEDRRLAAAVSGSLSRAEELGLESIALPAISTGIFGFPRERAAAIIFGAIRNYFEDHPASKLRLVRLVIIDQATLNIFLTQFKIWMQGSG
jgi:O-acetyl-ADP-ribose deacetylase (regulator of RNase III)